MTFKRESSDRVPGATCVRPRRIMIATRTRLRPIVIGSVVVALFIVGMWVVSRDGYPGDPTSASSSGTVTAKAIGPGIASQPANSWSNLGFVAISLLVLADAGRRRRGTSRMAIDDRYVVLYGR